MKKEIIKKDEFFKLLEKAYSINPGIDYLTINLDDYFGFIDNILDKLDTDNSSTGFIERKDYTFTIQKRENGEWIFGDISISVDNISYTIFQYRKYKSDKKKEMFKMFGQFDIYSTFFRLVEIGKVENFDSFIKNFFGDEYFKLKNQKLGRIDYKYDLFIEDDSFEIPKVANILNINSTTKNQEYILPITDKIYNIGVKKQLEKYKSKGKLDYSNIKEFKKGYVSSGWVYGNKKDKGIILRTYDKILDTLEKNKQNLFDDYFGKGKVIRFEGEFHTKFNKYKVKNKEKGKTYTFKELYDLVEKIERFFGMKESIKDEKFLYQYKQEKDNIYKDPHKEVKSGCSRLKKVQENGENPFIHYYNYCIDTGLNKNLVNENVNEFINYYQNLSFNKNANE